VTTRRSTWSSLARLGPVRRCAIIVRHEGRCAWCWTPLDRETVEIDHVVMRCDGGSDEDWNLVPACGPCNDRRPPGARIPWGILAEPLDLFAGRLLALAWYPSWLPARIDDGAARKRTLRARAPRGGGWRDERAAMRQEGVGRLDVAVEGVPW
jgi:HNH endonuclease